MCFLVKNAANLFLENQKGSVRLFFLSALVLAMSVGCAMAPRNSPGTTSSVKWETVIANYEAQDKTNAPASGCIVFTGSSYIRLWTNLVTDFPGLPVVNRGFGGCQLPDVSHYAGRIVIPYAPRKVVIYAGGNDINAHKSPEAVFVDFVALMKKLRSALPRTQLIFISCPPSPKRWAQTDKIRELNALIASYCQSHEIAFVNTFNLMLGADGLPRPDIYGPDQLHMNDVGYALWADAVRPHLR
jgi:lysophospholipase L1-like esterase